MLIVMINNTPSKPCIVHCPSDSKSSSGVRNSTYFIDEEAENQSSSGFEPRSAGFKALRY